MQKQCPVCGKEFNAAKTRIRMCSAACAAAFRRKPDPTVERECPVCGVVYEANKTRLKHGRETTCSRACSYKFRGDQLKSRVDCICSTCGVQFSRTPCQIKSKHSSVFCSRECHYAGRSLGLVRPAGQPYVYSCDGVIAQRKAGAESYASGDTVQWPEVEYEVADRLGAAGYTVVHQHIVSNGENYWVVDLFIPELKAVIEIDGPSHRQTRTRERDVQVDALCKSMGLRVFRIPDNGVSSDVCKAVFRSLAN